MLAHPEATPEASRSTAFDLISTFTARRRHGDMWDAFLDHAHHLSRRSPSELEAFDRRLRDDGHAQEWPVAAIRLWLRRRIDRVPSQETLAIGRHARDLVRREPTGDDQAQRLRTIGAELVILVSMASYEDAADVADVLRALLPQLSAEQQLRFATGTRHLLDLAVDAYVGACRLEDAEVALDARGSAPDDLTTREARATRGFIHAMRGDVAEAEAALCDLAALQATEEMTPRERIARAAVLLQDGAPAQAVDLLHEVEQREPGLCEWPFVVFLTARAFTATDPITGMERIHRLLHRHRNMPVSRRLQHLMHAAVADLALCGDDVPMAQRMLEIVEADDHLLRISAARVALITGDAEAVRDLMALLALPDLWPRSRAKALLLLAVHLHRSGNTAEARKALRRAGAVTTALKLRSFQTLVPRSDLHEISDGPGTGLPADPSTTGCLDAVLSRIRLTTRESVLLARLATGMTLSSIAQHEFVTLSTVKSQLRGLYRKLGVSSREDAVLVARRRGLLTPRVAQQRSHSSAAATHRR